MKPFENTEVLALKCIIGDFPCISTVCAGLLQLANTARYLGSLGLSGNTQHVNPHLKPEMLLPDAQARCSEEASAYFTEGTPAPLALGVDRAASSGCR